jgi:hypothetical protein
MAKKSNKYAVTVRLVRRDDQRQVSHIRQGRSTKLGITQFVVMLLQANERLSKAQRMTDETIRSAILAEYPESAGAKRLAEGKIGVWYWRNLYNIGHFTKGIRPKVGDPDTPKSFRYAFNGEKCSGKGKNGRSASDQRWNAKRKVIRAKQRDENKIKQKDFEKYVKQLAKAFNTLAWEYYIEARTTRLAEEKIERERSRERAIAHRQKFGEMQKARAHSRSSGEVYLTVSNEH